MSKAKRKVPEFVKLIDRLVTDSDLSQREIADALEYEKPNIITMFKQGTTRVPIDKVGPLARILGEDPIEMVNLWLKEYEPELKRVLDDAAGSNITRNERNWLERIRAAFPEGVPPCDERFEETWKVTAN